MSLDEVKRIRALPKIERLAGYLARMAALDECGAQLRLAHQHESTDYDEKWTPEEDMMWENHCDICDPWFYALSEEEHKLLEPITNFMACLCRGEDPEEHLILKYEFRDGGKYKRNADGQDVPEGTVQHLQGSEVRAEEGAIRGDVPA